MKTRNCPQCYGNGFITIGHRHPKCGYCNGKKRVTSEYVKWEISRSKFYDKLDEQLQAIIELKRETAMLKWLTKTRNLASSPNNKP